ncbi:MAG: response regulator transcription factor [Bacteroidota bacterium]
MVKLLVVDDHPIFRRGLRDVIKELFPAYTIQEAGGKDEVFSTLSTFKPDLIFLDIEMPGMSGIAMYSEIIKASPESKIVFLTMYKNEEIFYKAINTGAKGYLLKEDSHLEITECISRVLAGKTYISKEMLTAYQSYANYLKEQIKYKSLFDELTASEVKTLLLVIEDKSCQEIAEMLFVTAKTIENYRSSICKKLQLPVGNNSLIRWALHNKDLVTTHLKFRDKRA